MARNFCSYLHSHWGKSVWTRISILALGLSLLASPGFSQGNSGSIEGVVKDPSGSSVAGATVEITYAVSGFHRETTTGTDGSFRFTNIPFNPYHMVVTSTGFNSFTQDVEVRSTVPTNVQVALAIGTANTSVTVEANGGDLVENDSTFHTDVDQGIMDRLPLESASSSVTSLVTLVSPGVAADSNGNMHGLGDHAQNSFSVDGQAITDQTSTNQSRFRKCEYMATATTSRRRVSLATKVIQHTQAHAATQCAPVKARYVPPNAVCGPN